MGRRNQSEGHVLAAVAAGGLYAAGITRAQPYHRGLYAPTQPLSIGVALPEGERSECILYPLFGSQYPGEYGAVQAHGH